VEIDGVSCWLLLMCFIFAMCWLKRRSICAFEMSPITCLSFGASIGSSFPRMFCTVSVVLKVCCALACALNVVFVSSILMCLSYMLWMWVVMVGIVVMMKCFSFLIMLSNSSSC